MSSAGKGDRAGGELGKRSESSSRLLGILRARCRRSGPGRHDSLLSGPLDLLHAPRAATIAPAPAVSVPSGPAGTDTSFLPGAVREFG